MPSGEFFTNHEQQMGLVRWRIEWVVLLLGLPLTLLLPFIVGPSNISLLLLISIMGIAVIGLNVMVGFGGELVLAQGAFMAIGAYSTTRIITETNFGIIPAILVGALLTAGVAVVFGLPSYRVKGFYVAISTLALQFISDWFFQRNEFSVIHGGKRQILPREVDLFVGRFSVESGVQFYYLALVVLLLVALMAFNIRRTAVGRALLAVRQNDLSAGVLGVNVFKNKLVAMMLGGFIVGLAGGLYAFYLGFIDQEFFTISLTLQHYVMLLVGGFARTWGAILGAGIIELLNDGLREFVPILADVVPGLGISVFPIRAIVFGILIIAVLAIEPRGVLAVLGQIKEYLRKWPYSY